MGKTIDLKTRYYRLYPSDGYLGYAYEDYQADFDRSAFLVVDVYGLGFHPDDPVPTYRQDEHHRQDRPALAWLGSAEHEDRIGTFADKARSLEDRGVPSKVTVEELEPQFAIGP